MKVALCNRPVFGRAKEQGDYVEYLFSASRGIGPAPITYAFMLTAGKTWCASLPPPNQPRCPLAIEVQRRIPQEICRADNGPRAPLQTFSPGGCSGRPLQGHPRLLILARAYLAMVGDPEEPKPH